MNMGHNIHPVINAPQPVMSNACVLDYYVHRSSNEVLQAVHFQRQILRHEQATDK